MASWFHIKSIIQFRINLLGLGRGVGSGERYYLKTVAFLVPESGLFGCLPHEGCGQRFFFVNIVK